MQRRSDQRLFDRRHGRMEEAQVGVFHGGNGFRLHARIGRCGSLQEKKIGEYFITNRDLSKYFKFKSLKRLFYYFFTKHYYTVITVGKKSTMHVLPFTNFREAN